MDMAVQLYLCIITQYCTYFARMHSRAGLSSSDVERLQKSSLHQLIVIHLGVNCSAHLEKKVPARFELALLDSESNVLTARLRDL